MRFVAVDVETANARMRSICQIGVAVFENGAEIASESLLIDPKEEFDGMNVSIHGIDESHVVGAATFPTLGAWLQQYIGDQVVVCHTHFDRTAIHQAYEHHQMPAAQCRWLDTSKVARRAWPKYANAGYGLGNLAKDFGIVFQHHDALHDARTAGLILLRAMEESGLDLDQWIARTKTGISGSVSGREVRSGDGDGPLVGHTVVFTGALSIVRRLAADLAHTAGAAVEGGVTRNTTILVVGDTDLISDIGTKPIKSSKHLKAEALAGMGQPIRFLAESDFMAIVA